LGIYDKDLLIDAETIDRLWENGIMPLSDLSEVRSKIWFILKDVKTVIGKKSGNPYFKLTITDVIGQDLTFNYFFREPRGGWQLNSIYWSELYRNEGWINVAKGSYLNKMLD
jgi:hypothetical protein